MVEDVEPLGVALDFTDMYVAPPRMQGPLNAEKNDHVRFDGFNNFPVAGSEQVVVIRDNHEMEAKRLVNIRCFLGGESPIGKGRMDMELPFQTHDDFKYPYS